MPEPVNNASSSDEYGAHATVSAEASEPTIHGYYRGQGYESCPDCGEWIKTVTADGIARCPRCNHAESKHNELGYCTVYSLAHGECGCPLSAGTHAPMASPDGQPRRTGHR